MSSPASPSPVLSTPPNGTDLLVFGELLWDLLPGGAQPGGAPANVAIQASGLGIPTLVVSAVGDDALGREMIARLRQQGLRLDGVPVLPGVPTGVVDVTLSGAGIPSYTIREGVAWDQIRVTPALLDIAKSARAFCFGSLAQRAPVSRQTCRELLAHLPEGCIRFFDVNVRKPFPALDILRDSLACSDVLKLNDEELPLLAEWLGLPLDEAAFTEALAKTTPVRTVLLTRGPRGATVLEPGAAPVAIPAAVVEKIVDTVGAGDAFSAGFLGGLLKGFTARQAAEQGSGLASQVCGQAGAWLPPKN